MWKTRAARVIVMRLCECGVCGCLLVYLLLYVCLTLFVVVVVGGGGGVFCFVSW